MKFREEYLHALGIRNADQCKLKSARKLAHDVRQFEIELYWKRATYFWAFQLIAFTALGLLLKDGHISPLGQLPLGRLLIPAPIGVITALAGYLTARGSKFWQTNWEAHVDLLEDQTKERLTHIILCRDYPQFSVSRVNQRLLAYLGWGWMAVLVAGAVPSVANCLRQHSSWAGGIVLILTVVFALALLSGTGTDLRGCAYGYGGEMSWGNFRQPNVWQRFRIWRKVLHTIRPKREPTAVNSLFIIWRDRSARDIDADELVTLSSGEPATDENQP